MAIKLPVEVRVDPDDAYATVRIYDAAGDLFLNIHGSERYREANALGNAEADANQIVSALNGKRWTATSERLPDEDGIYWVACNDGDEFPDRFAVAEGEWRGAVLRTVIAWHELPAPYQPTVQSASEEV